MNTLLDVVIGLSVTYLFYALLCSVVVELFAGITRQRGALLQEGIVGMLGVEFAKRLYQHPLIRLSTNRSNPPSYIGSRLFALALANLTTKVSMAPGPNPIPVLVINSNLPRPLRRSLTTLALGTQGNEIHTIDRLERWYTEMNEHLTAQYSRTARKWTFIAAIAITIVSQVDSCQIAIAMAKDSALRAGMAKAAEAKGNSLKQIGDALVEAKLPIGWPSAIEEWNSKNVIDRILLVILKLAGWIATVLAVQLGAPFWFEQLSRIMNVRLTKKPNA